MQEKLWQMFSSVAQSCLTLCDPMNRSTPGLPVHHQLPEFTQTHVHRVSDAIQPSHPLSSSCPPAPNPSQHQSLFRWVNSSHEVVTNVDSVLKSRAITLLRKVHIVKATVFPVVMYRRESWTIKKAPKNWCFWTAVLEKTLESPLDCKEIQPVNPKGISPEYSLEGLMLKLKLHYFGHLMRTVNSFAISWHLVPSLHGK